ncbi:MAG TPA: hypothetical protein VF062_26250 [Candidatus Limnocylindrales bacterium]
MTISVSPGYLAVRKRPEMYFGVARDDPPLTILDQRAASHSLQTFMI